jgi:hypothetical protein
MMNTRKLYWLYDGAIFIFIVAFFLLAPLQIIIHDDAYVYFTYARNFVEGRPFAYDPRNIRSEGFTSLLYMLMLVPAELLRVNPILAGALINMTALALTIVALGQAVRATSILSARAAAFFTLLLTILLTQDRNIRLLVFSGFESLLGLLCATGIVISIAYALDERRAATAQQRWMSAFFVASFLAHLIRPEYLLIGALGGAVLLWRSPDRAALLRQAAVFVLVMAGYYLFKLAIFGDLFPTSFYRKVRASWLGPHYVNEWLSEYCNVLLFAAITFIVLSAALRQRALWLILLVGSAVSILIFYAQSTPLSGFEYRFLVVPTLALYALLAIGVIALARRFLAAQGQQLGQLLKATLALVWIPVLMFDLELMAQGINAPLGLVKRAQDALDAHPYIQLGRYWREQLDNPEDITVAFIDAGAIPYALNSRFLDVYGLTEPPIARMFGKLNAPEQIEEYIRYILNQKPDVFLMYAFPDFSAVTRNFHNIHSPLLGDAPSMFFEKLQADGLAYGCSIDHGVRLHLLVRRADEAHFERLMDAFCSHPSVRRFPEGLTVVASDGQIHFP